jgi:hypothetical protein
MSKRLKFGLLGLALLAAFGLPLVSQAAIQGQDLASQLRNVASQYETLSQLLTQNLRQLDVLLGDEPGITVGIPLDPGIKELTIEQYQPFREIIQNTGVPAAFGLLEKSRALQCYLAEINGISCPNYPGATTGRGQNTGPSMASRINALANFFESESWCLDTNLFLQASEVVANFDTLGSLKNTLANQRDQLSPAEIADLESQIGELQNKILPAGLELFTTGFVCSGFRDKVSRVGLYFSRVEAVLSSIKTDLELGNFAGSYPLALRSIVEPHRSFLAAYDDFVALSLLRNFGDQSLGNQMFEALKSTIRGEVMQPLIEYKDQEWAQYLLFIANMPEHFQGALNPLTQGINQLNQAYQIQPLDPSYEIINEDATNFQYSFDAKINTPEAECLVEIQSQGIDIKENQCQFEETIPKSAPQVDLKVSALASLHQTKETFQPGDEKEGSGTGPGEPPGGEPNAAMCQNAQVAGPDADPNFPGEAIYRFTGNQPNDLGNEFFCQWIVKDAQGNEFDVRGSFGCISRGPLETLDFHGNYPADTDLVVTYTVEQNNNQVCQREWRFSAGITPIEIKDTDGDGILDHQDPCPNDPDPNCRAPQPPVPPPGGTTTPAISGGLVPCGGPGQPECTFCHFFALLENILDFITLKLVPILGALFFAIGGLMVMTAGPSSQRAETGYRILVGVFIGAIIVYAAWVLIDSFLTFLVNPEVFPKFWFKIQCSI